MARRAFLKSLGVAGVSLAAPSLAWSADRSSTKKLNFVFILADDLGWSDLGCFGSSFYETPNLDQLAAQGMRFTNAYEACPVCSPRPEPVS